MAQPLVPTVEELNTYRSFVTSDVLAFTDGATGYRQPIGVSVRRGLFDQSKSPPQVKFTVTMEIGAVKVGSSGRKFPAGYVERIPEELVAEAYDEIIAKTPGPAIVKLASQLARATICGQKRIKLDPAKVTETSFSPAQGQKVTAALGGDLDRLLGMSTAELERLDLGDMSKSTRVVPNIDFAPGNAAAAGREGDVRVRMVCSL